MTVNERLIVSGLLKEFDKAKKSKDKNALVVILRRVQVEEGSIGKILAQFGVE